MKKNELKRPLHVSILLMTIQRKESADVDRSKKSNKEKEKTHEQSYPDGKIDEGPGGSVHTVRSLHGDRALFFGG